MTVRLFLAAAAIAVAASTFAQQPAEPAGVVGHWTDGYRVFAFMPGGYAAITIAKNGAPFSILTYETAGSQLRFADIDGFNPCVGMSALYEFEIDGKTMTITAVNDPCPVRENGGQPIALTRMPLRTAGEGGNEGGGSAG